MGLIPWSSLAAGRLLPMPKNLLIEVTSFCNLRCMGDAVFCDRFVTFYHTCIRREGEGLTHVSVRERVM